MAVIIESLYELHMVALNLLSYIGVSLFAAYIWFFCIACMHPFSVFGDIYALGTALFHTNANYEKIIMLRAINQILQLS